MRIAFLADIHSNLPALEAVLLDLHLMAPDVVYLAGDQVNRCPWPNEVLDLIQANEWPAISGNHEILVTHLAQGSHQPVFDDRRRFADLWWTVENLKPEHRATIAALPEEQRVKFENMPAILMLHGLRDNPWEGITHDMSDDQIAARIDNISEPLIVTAHTHYPLARTVGKQQVLNPGSVGMPYNGDARAHYLLLDNDGNRWKPIFRRVEYDHGAVREAFERNGLFQLYGSMGELYWRTIATGDPWVSDFQIWLRAQPPIVHEDFDKAVEVYLSVHGPGKWAFTALRPVP